MIPENIERIHIEKALEEIDMNGVQNGAQSTTYDLINNGKRYPPKLVISIANKFANGNELDRTNFSGGENTKAFKILRENGYQIESKVSLQYIVQEFLKQAETGNLKTKHYPSKYRGLDVSISFGAGNPARIPWVAFLKPPNKVMDGIYPGILYYKEQNLLVITYGKSETNTSAYSWNVTDAETIDDYFQRKWNSKPDRYGKSLIKAVFETNAEIDYKKLKEELDQLIDTYKLLSFDDNKINEPSTAYKKNLKRYWLYSPGENAEFWDEFYQQGIMGLGWDYLGGLENYDSKEEIISKMQEEEQTDGSKKNDATACDDFYNKLSIGDVVIAKRGRSTLIGYGTVISDYYYDNERQTFQKLRKVKWEKKGNWDAGLPLVLKTLTDITRYPSEIPECDYYYERLLAIIDEKVEEPSKELDLPLNCILYGPPGTGKTYKTKSLAVHIVNPNFSASGTNGLEKRKSIVLEYDRFFKEEQIVFTTFHQSFGYEDFVEGIKPSTTEDKKVIYDIAPGVFKKLCEKAKNNWLEFKKGKVNGLSFDEAFGKLKEEWEENENISFPLKTQGKEYRIIGFTESSIQFEKASGGTGHTLSIATLRDAYYDKKEIRSTGVGIYYPGILNKLRSYDSEGLEEIIPTSSNPILRNYVLIIDEINRGNVSGIFGELITLLEPDKRMGRSEEISVELPYSKEQFTVPPNVYIIGTMNTADRSVEALDTALRRRFAFEELMPIPELLEYIEFDKFNLSQVLKVINERIEALLDRDHTIGHSYFINIQSGDIDALRLAFENKVIPLLQEYFYHDYEKIALILGEGFVDHKEAKVKFANFKKVDQPELSSSFELKIIEDIEEAILILLNEKDEESE